MRRIEYAYDAQGNVVLLTSYDAATGGSIVNQVQRTYNGLGQLTAEYQAVSGAVDTSTTPVVLYAYTEMADGVNNSRLVSMTYPDGRVLDYNYASGLDDSISRLSSISDSSGTLESYAYLGLDTIVQRVQPQAGTELTYTKLTGESNGDAGDQYTGLDRFGRVVDQRWLDTSTSAATDRVQYGYDRDGNVMYANNLLNSAFSDLYHASGTSNGYDNLNQITDYARGTLSDSNSDGVPDTVASPTDSESWSLTALGNPANVYVNGTAETSTNNAQNELVTVGSATLTYDANGNMTTDELGRQLVYDAWNRIVELKDSTGTALAAYTYDAAGRRVTETHGTTETVLYNSANWQVLEERNSSGAVQAQYVWSAAGIDTLVLRDRDSTGSGTLDERLYVQQDANNNVTALVNTSGAVVERYTYAPYGAMGVFAPDWTARSAISFGWQYLFQGGRYEGAADLYDFRNREYSPLGRWTQDDPLGFGAGDANLYRTEGNNPATYNDPSGEVINLGLAAAGGLIGAGAGAATAWWTGGDIARGALVGAGAGFVGGLTFGVSLAAGAATAGWFGIAGGGLAGTAAGVATYAAAGVISGQASRATANVLNDKPLGQGLFDPVDMAIDAAVGVFMYGGGRCWARYRQGSSTSSLPSSRAVPQISESAPAILAEADAAAQLASQEAAIPGSHFFSRHGAQTTIEQQFVRATTGVTPDGVALNPVSAGRFLTNQAQLAAAEQAQIIFSQTGRNSFSFSMSNVIGEGFTNRGAAWVITNNVTAVFKNGSLFTLFPKLAALL